MSLVRTSDRKSGVMFYRHYASNNVVDDINLLLKFNLNYNHKPLQCMSSGKLLNLYKGTGLMGNKV